MMMKTGRQQIADSKQGKKIVLSAVRCLPSTKKGLLSTDRGFSIVELMITMVVFVIVMVAATQIFTGLLTQFKQQSRIGESDIEGAVGLNIMRYDIAHAGYGLPLNLTTGACGSTSPCDTTCAWSCLPNYTEAAADTSSGAVANPADFNDAGAQAPRAIVSGCSKVFGNSCTGVSNGQSYLVIKSAVAATNYAAGKAINLNSAGISPSGGWTPNIQNVNAQDNNAAHNSPDVRAVVVALGTTNSPLQLVHNSAGQWCSTYDNSTVSATASCANTGVPANFAPSDASETRFVYGIDPDTDLRMPFNRTDYFIKVPADASQLPRRCAPNTGILYKATVKQADGTLSLLPLLDCVAYMHVDYMLDTNVDGTVETRADDIMTGIQNNAIACPTNDPACLIWSELKEVRVYIIAQEGQRDATYDFSNGGTRKSFSVTETLGSASQTISLPGVASGVADMSTLIGDPEYKYYRWKLYTLVVQPNNLR
jgi:prepilin-type N-terminal cleavage/methylation domain-containing protein